MILLHDNYVEVDVRPLHSPFSCRPLLQFLLPLSVVFGRRRPRGRCGVVVAHRSAARLFKKVLEELSLHGFRGCCSSTQSKKSDPKSSTLYYYTLVFGRRQQRKASQKLRPFEATPQQQRINKVKGRPVCTSE